MLGSEIVAYDAAHHIVIWVDLPIAQQIVEASQHAPYPPCGPLWILR